MKRRWPLRLLEFSPLIILGIALALWFAVPAGLRMVALESRAQLKWTELNQLPAPDRTLMALQRIEEVQRGAAQARGEVPDEGPSAEAQLQSKADVVTGSLMKEPGRFYDAEGAIKPFAVPGSDPAFDVLREWEQYVGARVAVFVYPPMREPAVVLQSIADTSVLTAKELRELETSGTLEALRHVVRGSETTVLPVDIEGLNSGSGERYGNRDIFYSSRMVGGHAYEFYAVHPAGAGGPDDESTLNGDVIELADYQMLNTDENRRAVETAALRYDGAAFVIGPTDDDLIPVRIPEGMTEAQARAAFAQRGLATSHYGDWRVLEQASPELSSQMGGAKWFGATSAFALSDTAVTEGGRAVVRQPLAFISLYDSNPEIPILWDRLGKTMWKQALVWLSANALFVAGALAVMFLVSLVMSPVAFLYERKQTEEAELERERERVRRETRERVVGRLTELSVRMDTAAATASTRTQREVAEVAHDIESTVDELRAILGELSRRGSDRDE